MGRADGKISYRILLLWIGFGFWQSQARRRWWTESRKLAELLRRVNVLALSIELALLFSLSGRPSALLLGGLNFFLEAHTDLLCRGCSSFRLFPIMLSLGGRFPLTDPLSHELGTVGFTHVHAFHKQIDHAHIAPIVIQFKLLARQSIEQTRARVPASLKRQARPIMHLVCVTGHFSIDGLHQEQLQVIRGSQILGNARLTNSFFPEHRTRLSAQPIPAL